MADAEEKRNLQDIFGDSDSDDDLAIETGNASSEHALSSPGAAAAAEAPAAALAKKAALAAADSDSDLDLELDSDSDDDDEEARLKELVKRQTKKAPSRRRAPQKKAAAKPRKKSKVAPRKSAKANKRKAAGELDEEGRETAEDLAFIEKGSDDDDDDDVIKTEGGWTEDADIDREDEDPSDKKWLDQMWGRNKKKKKEKGIEEYKAIALRFKQRMEEAADDDEAANRRGEPALERLSMLGEVRTEMRKLELQHLYLEECGILSTFKRWLEPLNGKAFPNFNLKNGVMEVVDEMTNPEMGGNAVNPDQVRDSGIGGIMMLYKTKDKNPTIRNLAQKIIDRWSRPVLGVGSYSHRRLHKEVDTASGKRYTKIQARREQRSVDRTTKHNQKAQALDDYLSDRAKNAKLGDAGFVFHAGWPMPGEKNYKKNVMQDRRLTQMEKELEDRNIALEDYLKEKSRPRAMSRTINRTTANNKRRRMQAVKNVIDSRSVYD